LAGLVLYPVSKGRKALQHREFSDKSPIEQLAEPLVSIRLLNFLCRSITPEGIAAMGGVYQDLDAGEQALRLLREFGPPTADIFQPMPCGSNDA
jgi:hypothetical protein